MLQLVIPSFCIDKCQTSKKKSAEESSKRPKKSVKTLVSDKPVVVRLRTERGNQMCHLTQPGGCKNVAFCNAGRLAFGSVQRSREAADLLCKLVNRGFPLQDLYSAKIALKSGREVSYMGNSYAL